MAATRTRPQGPTSYTLLLMALALPPVAAQDHRTWLPHIRAGLDHEDANVRASCARYLGTFGDDREVPLLAWALEQEDAVPVKLALLTALVDASPGIARSSLLLALDDGSKAVRRRALYGLGRHARADDGEAILDRCRASADPEMLWQSLRTLPLICDLDLTDVLCELLRKPGGLQATDALALMKRGACADAILPLLDHGHAGIRAQAAAALVRIGQHVERARPHLTESFVPTSFYSREWERVAHAFLGMGLQRSDLDTVVAELEQRPVLWLAEAHGIAATRTVQIEVLSRAVKRFGKERVVLVYERPAETFQEPVIAAARELGLETVTFEPPADDPRSMLLRDRDRLISDGVRKLVRDGKLAIAIYGASHTLGAGHAQELVGVPSTVLALFRATRGIAYVLAADPAPWGQTFRARRDDPVRFYVHPIELRGSNPAELPDFLPGFLLARGAASRPAPPAWRPAGAPRVRSMTGTSGEAVLADGTLTLRPVRRSDSAPASSPAPVETLLGLPLAAVGDLVILGSSGLDFLCSGLDAGGGGSRLLRLHWRPEASQVVVADQRLWPGCDPLAFAWNPGEQRLYVFDAEPGALRAASWDGTGRLPRVEHLETIPLPALAEIPPGERARVTLRVPADGGGVHIAGAGPGTLHVWRDGAEWRQERRP